MPKQPKPDRPGTQAVVPRTPSGVGQPPSPIQLLIDSATGFNGVRAARPTLSAEDKEAAAQIGRDVVSNFRTMYPDVLRYAPSTAAIHLRNTIASEIEQLLLSRTHP